MAEAMMTDELLKEQFNNLVQQTLQNEDKSSDQDFLQNNNANEQKDNFKTEHYDKS